MMKLNEEEREFLETMRKAERDNNTNMLISVYALLDKGLEREGAPMSGKLAGYKRGQYKRAIKRLREVQAWAMIEHPGFAAYYDEAVRYIRERCLNRVGNCV